MDKNIIGDWGAELDHKNYGRALAALGVLQSTGTQQHPFSDDPQAILDALIMELRDGERTVVWRGAFNPRDTIHASWRETGHWDPATLAKAWDLYLEKYSYDQLRSRPRLAVEAAWRQRRDLFDLDVLAGWLGNPEVGCQALVLIPEDLPEGGRYFWHWPVRVGIPTGRAGRALMKILKTTYHDWVEELGWLHFVGEARDACDLLILPAGVAAQLVEQPRLRLRASFIICLDDTVKSSSSLDKPATQLLMRTGAAGVALVGHLRRREMFDWYREIIRDLSHDMPVHAAVWDIRYHLKSIPPAILGSPQLMDRLRILAVAEQLDRKRDLMQRQGYLKPPADFGAGTLSQAEFVRTAPFTSEEGYGKPAAQQFSRDKAELDKTSQPRWIQADIWHSLGAEARAKALRPSSPSLLSCSIGPSAEKRRDAAFPEQALDFQDGPVEITLQIELAGAAVVATPSGQPFRDFVRQEGTSFTQALRQLMPKPKTSRNQPPLVGLASKSILLPSVGSSQKAEFAVWPQQGVAEVSGRIAIIHKNRIIQTARFTAPVGREDEVTTEVVVQAEQILYPRLEDVVERRDFDAQMMVADDLGGRLRLTFSQDGKPPEEVLLENMQSVITGIRNTVLAATYRTGDILDLTTSKEMRDLLFSLAYHGTLLYQHMYNRLGARLEGIERIDLICFGNLYFPLEYVYDGPTFNTKAEICPNALQALASGECDSCKAKGASNVICPLYFWGFCKVIERHANRPADSATEEERRRLPTPARAPFGALTPALFAASDKAFDFTDGKTWESRLIDALEHLGAGHLARTAPDWTIWRSRIQEVPAPKLLVLLPHSDTILTNIEVLEIGAGDQLLKTEIEKDKGKDLVGALEIPQLLLLLGCATAQVGIDFAPYPELFHDAGADIIIAPLAPILGADAAPIAQRIAALLAERTAKGGEITFGELLKQVRRDLLAQGHPGVLGLVNFGDADWIFGG